jgi:multidrug efflux pump
VVSSGNGQTVKLEDLGRVELGPADNRSALRYRGSPSVGVGIVRQSKSNLVKVADAVHRALPGIGQELPPGVRIISTFDQSIFVKRSIQEAEETLIVAASLVVIIIFIFLRNFRATIIPAVAIPTSIVSTFAVMYFLGFSINNLTLLALTLAIGIVVDDAIIVLENAFRHQEELHEEPEAAATNGTREIAFAVIATTISLVAVFTPLAFLQGSTGRLFNEFGIAVAGSVAISGFVALTITPMLCAKILRVPPRHGWLYATLERGFNGLASGYARTLRWSLHHRIVVVAVVLAAALGAVVTFRSLKREFVPPEDRGFFFTMVIAPEGSTINYTDGYLRQIEKFFAEVPEVEHYFSIAGAFFGSPSRGGVFARMTDWSDRDRTVQEIIGEVQPRLFGVPGIMAFAINPPGVRQPGAVRGAAFRLPAASGRRRYPDEADPTGAGPGERGQRPPGQQARAHRDLRPGSRRGLGRAGARRRLRAANPAGRPGGEHLHPEQPPLRRDRSAFTQRARNPK